jgi:hypothetical protein
MKTSMFFAVTLVIAANGPAHAGEIQSDSHYGSSEVSFDLFGSGSIGQQTIDKLSGARIRHDIRLGAGAGISYFFTRYIGIGAEAYSENPHHNSFIDGASANLYLRYPLGHSGVAPYAFAGAGRQLEPARAWFGQVGAGLEWRFTPQVGFFVDGRYVGADGGRNYGLGRGGIRISF